MANPKCSFCPNEGIYFLCFSIFAPGIRYLKIGDITFDAPICQECGSKAKAKDVLTDNMWRQIQAQVRADAKKAKVKVPPLERVRTMLLLRPFTRQKDVQGAKVIDLKANAPTPPPALPPSAEPTPPTAGG